MLLPYIQAIRFDDELEDPGTPVDAQVWTLRDTRGDGELPLELQHPSGISVLFRTPKGKSYSLIIPRLSLLDALHSIESTAELEALEAAIDSELEWSCDICNCIDQACDICGDEH